MFKKLFYSFFFITFSFQISFSVPLKDGFWRGVFTLNENDAIYLPFLFEVKSENFTKHLIILNSDEQIIVDDLHIINDSLFFKMPVYDTEFKAKLYGDSIAGIWIVDSKLETKAISFKAYHNVSKRFVNLKLDTINLYSGKWEVTFNNGTTNSNKALGLFHQDSLGYFRGTFLTVTGDFRYLEGYQVDNKIVLVGFDGAHAYYFKANIEGNFIRNGVFYSGSNYKSDWTAVRNDHFNLPSPDSITTINDASNSFYISYPNENGQLISLSDSRYKNKVLIIQLLGSWCPNCMDETAYLSQLYELYKNKSVEIIGLAFERTEDFNNSSASIKRLKKRFNINYEILITSLSGKDRVRQTFPMLTNFIAFPTILIIDKSGKVRHIHAGFSGPATGLSYLDFKMKTEVLIENLLRN